MRPKANSAELLPVAESYGLQELVRQTTGHCHDPGQLYAELLLHLAQLYDIQLLKAVVEKYIECHNLSG
jgi:hypothetical protein